MSKVIRIRNVPDAVHGVMKARAERAGIPLSDYMLGELRRIAEQPSMRQIRQRQRRMQKGLPPVSRAREK